MSIRDFYLSPNPFDSGHNITIHLNVDRAGTVRVTILGAGATFAGGLAYTDIQVAYGNNANLRVINGQSGTYNISARFIDEKDDRDSRFTIN